MSIEAARKLVESLDLNIQEGEVGDPYFRDPNVHPFPLNEKGFRLIRPVKSGRRIAFVDGGNQEILGAPNFSIQLNRVFAGVWDQNQRVEVGLPRIEFFSATFSKFRNDEIYYDTILVPSVPDFAEYLPNASDLSFNSMDRSIMNGNQRADIERVASIGRRFAEWRFAAHVAGVMRKDDVLVMDGTLQTTFVNEGHYLKELEEAAVRNGVILSGLSKSSTLFTTTGLSLLGAVSKMAEGIEPDMEWYYPVAESTSKDHNVMILAVKLNTVSERVFRYELNREQFNGLGELRLNQILSELARNSSEITLAGYPYGLIDADRFARVSYDELEYYRGIIASQVSGLGKWQKFSRYVHASDVHSILNMLVR